MWSTIVLQTSIPSFHASDNFENWCFSAFNAVSTILYCYGDTMRWNATEALPQLTPNTRFINAYVQIDISDRQNISHQQSARSSLSTECR